MLIPAVDEARILALRSLTEVKTPRRMAARLMTEKRISTMLSQEALVGDEVGVDAGVVLQPAAHLGVLWVANCPSPGAARRRGRCATWRRKASSSVRW